MRLRELRRARNISQLKLSMDLQLNQNAISRYETGLREDSDCTQAQMAKILNCSQQVYSNYELGQRDIPTDILIKLSEYYNVSTDYLLGLTDKKERNI